MKFITPRMATLLCLVMLSSFLGVSAVLVGLKELNPPRIVGLGLSGPPLPFLVQVTVTDDDGTALPAGMEIEFAVNIEFDASLVLNRVSYPFRPETQIAVVIRTDGGTQYSHSLLFIWNNLDFFIPSFKFLVSLESTPTSPTPTTITGRPSFEVWVYNVVAYPPDFLIMTPPSATPKSGKDVRLFAIGGFGLDSNRVTEASPMWVTDPVGRNLTVSEENLLKLPSAYDQENPLEQGWYWTLPGERGNKQADCRFGEYTLQSFVNDGFYRTGINPTAILNPRSKHLDTRGMEVITVFRSSDDPEVLDESVTFGVKMTKLSGSIRWFKDNRFLGKGRSMRTICKVAEAGLYRLQRSTRRKRSWFVLIRVVLSECLRSEVFVFFEQSCVPRDELPGPYTVGCLNGGVPGPFLTICHCPPCFRGAYCERLAPTGNPFAIAESRDFTCGELPGGNKKCKGYKFCLGGHYGCSCGCGWHGPDCDKPCQKGFYGPDCSQKCNCLASSCDRFTGACDTPKCPVGFQGFNCQIPLTIRLGNPSSDFGN